jgi:hypothetical protein
LVCTHATLVAAFQSLSPEDKQTHWNNLLICVDETHHIQMHEIADEVYNMNSLGQVVDYSFRNNNEIILVSATMFRGDQKGLVSDELLKDAIKYNLPFDKYMEEMKHLKSFSYDFIIDTNEYTEDISKCIKNLFDENLKKLFIYIPHPKSYMSSGNKIKEIQDILEQLKNNLNGDKITLDENTGIYHITNILGLDYKVCDLVDENLSKRSIRFVNNEIINKDRNALDCVIALNRAKEGFDWEHANGMIVVGQRNSLTDVIQMVGRLLRDKQGKEKVKALHMLPFSPNQPTAPNLDNSLNDFFKAIAISLLMEDVFAPTSLQTNDDSAPTGQLSGATPSVSSNIFDDLELDENQRLDLFDKAQKALVNVAGGLVESQGTYSPEELKEQMPSIMKKWVEENKIEADEQQIEELAKKIYNQFAKRSLQMQGINVSNINWQMIESADPIEFTLRYVGKDTTLESLKELRRLIASGESDSNELCHKLCQWIVENKRNPSLLNEEETFLFYFMTDMRKGRNNPISRGRKWYQSNQKIAESYNLINIFDNKNYESIAIENCHLLCKFITDKNCYPKASSEDNFERSLNTFMQNQRSNKLNKSQGIWYPVLDQITSAYNLNSLFNEVNYEAICNEKVHELCKFILSNNRMPTSASSDETERKMQTLLNGLRQGKKSPSLKSRTFYTSSEEIALSYGLEKLFDITDKEVVSNSICYELCEYVIKNGKIPAKTTKDEREKFLYAWLHTQKKNKISCKYFYESNQSIADSFGLNDIFDKIDLEKKSNQLCIEWCKFYIKNKKKPSQNDEYKDIYNWYYSQLKAKNGKGNNRFYLSNEKIAAEQFGLSNIFGETEE